MKINKEENKIAFDLFYSGVAFLKSAKMIIQNIPKNVSLFSSEPNFIDVIHLQLIKQTTDYPNDEFWINYWFLFLTVVRLFPSSEEREQERKTVILKYFITESFEVSNGIKFTFLRFSTICFRRKSIIENYFFYAHLISNGIIEKKTNIHISYLLSTIKFTWDSYLLSI
jgi:hypothetical protein